MSTVFITGAVRNTGLAIAKKFAANGYSVAISSRVAADAEKTAALIVDNYHVRAEGYGLDLTDVDDIKRVFDRIRDDFGELDVFVPNSANLGVGVEFLNATQEDFDDLMNVNLRGTYFCCQQAALLMKEKHHGAIVIMGSVHYERSIWGRSLYAASKGALASLTRAMAVELGEYGIRTNLICAGAIRTDRWDGFTSEKEAARRANWPVGIESTGEDIANGVFYLGTDLSKTVSGTDLTIDSGVSACLLSYNGGKH